MNLASFVEEREPDWAALEALVGAVRRGRVERLGPDRIRALGAHYRAAAADLALARRRWPADPVVGRLERLVGTARHLVYAAEHRRGSVASFVTHGYWRRVRERPVLLALSAALLLGPAVVTATWSVIDPAAAVEIVPEAYRSVTEPRTSGEDLGLGGAEQAEFSSAIFTNNIRVSFLAFAGGILAGLGTAFVLVFNGSFLGAVGGLAFGAGNGPPFMELVVAHGFLELSLIAVTAAAGLRMGWALIDPGRGTRKDALVAEGRHSVEVVLGTIPWFVLAGLIEGFITGTGLPLAVLVAIGGTAGGAYWLAVWRLGAAVRGALTSELSTSR